MPLRPKYPEAPGKRDHYRDVVSRLSACRTKIQDELRSASQIQAGDYESSHLLGDYYNDYNAQKNEWITQHSRIISAFYSFLRDLDVCIQNARNQENLWKSRIPMMEEY